MSKKNGYIGNANAAKSVTKDLRLFARCTAQQRERIAGVLNPGETLSGFVLESVLKEIERRINNETRH